MASVWPDSPLGQHKRRPLCTGIVPACAVRHSGACFGGGRLQIFHQGRLAAGRDPQTAIEQQPGDLGTVANAGASAAYLLLAGGFTGLFIGKYCRYLASLRRDAAGRGLGVAG